MARVSSLLEFHEQHLDLCFIFIIELKTLTLSLAYSTREGDPFTAVVGKSIHYCFECWISFSFRTNVVYRKTEQTLHTLGFLSYIIVK